MISQRTVDRLILLELVDDETKLQEAHGHSGVYPAAVHAETELRSRLLRILDGIQEGNVSYDVGVEEAKAALAASHAAVVEVIQGRFEEPIPATVSARPSQADLPESLAQIFKDLLELPRFTAQISNRLAMFAHQTTWQTLNQGMILSLEGLAVFEVELTWVTAGDDRVCDECSDREDSYGLEEAMALALPDSPPVHPFCRCYWDW